MPKTLNRIQMQAFISCKTTETLVFQKTARISDAPKTVVYIGTPYKGIQQERLLAEGLASLIKKDSMKQASPLNSLDAYFDQQRLIPKKSFLVRVPKDYVAQNIMGTQEHKRKRGTLSMDFEKSASSGFLIKKLKECKKEKERFTINHRRRAFSDNNTEINPVKRAEGVAPLTRKLSIGPNLVPFGQIIEAEDEQGSTERGLDPSKNPLACPDRAQRRHKRTKSLPLASQKLFKSLNDLMHMEIKEVKTKLGALALTSPEIESKKYQKLQMLHDKNNVRGQQFADKMANLREGNSKLLDEFLNIVEQPLQTVTRGFDWAPKLPSQIVGPIRKSLGAISKFS